MVPLDDALLAQNRGALEDIVQFADVARPGVREQRVPRIVVETGRRAAHGLPEIHEESLGKQRDVADALTQGRQRNVEDLEAIEQIFAERAAGHRLAQVAIARRDDAHVRFLGAGAAEAPEFALLQESQELSPAPSRSSH